MIRATLFFRISKTRSFARMTEKGYWWWWWMVARIMVKMVILMIKMKKLPGASMKSWQHQSYFRNGPVMWVIIRKRRTDFLSSTRGIVQRSAWWCNWCTHWYPPSCCLLTLVFVSRQAADRLHPCYNLLSEISYLDPPLFIPPLDSYNAVLQHNIDQSSLYVRGHRWPTIEGKHNTVTNQTWTILYPCSTKARAVLGNPFPTTEDILS